MKNRVARSNISESEISSYWNLFACRDLPKECQKPLALDSTQSAELVELTRAGKRTHDGFLDDRTAMGLAMLEPLTADERERLLALFRKITAGE